MDHAEVVEGIELAAVEPDGLARLAAGDTPEAAAIAGHLAGCRACADTLTLTARAATAAREAIRELPDPALRARTLAFVREVGVERPAGAAATPASEAPDGASSTPGALPIGLTRPRSRAAWWVVAGAAAVLVAAVAGFTAGGAAQPPADGGGTIAAVETTVHIAEQPDAVHVDLVAPSTGAARGSVMYSASTGELALIVSGLEPAPSGSTYSCWVEQAGQRRRIGALYLSGGDGAWAGIVDGLDALGAGAVFGVSLTSGGTPDGTPVLTGGR